MNSKVLPLIIFFSKKKSFNKVTIFENLDKIYFYEFVGANYNTLHHIYYINK